MLVDQKKSLKAGKMVNTNHADTLIRNYKQQRWINNSKRLGKEDSLSVWYSLEELETFIEKIKDQGGEGIRLYFGVYDENYSEHPVYAGRQTIIFVGTKLKQTDNGSVNKDIYFNTEKGATILAYNVGRPCPPFCGGEGVGISIFDKGNEGLIIA